MRPRTLPQPVRALVLILALALLPALGCASGAFSDNTAPLPGSDSERIKVDSSFTYEGMKNLPRPAYVFTRGEAFLAFFTMAEENGFLDSPPRLGASANGKTTIDVADCQVAGGTYRAFVDYYTLDLEEGAGSPHLMRFCFYGPIEENAYMVIMYDEPAHLGEAREWTAPGGPDPWLVPSLDAYKKRFRSSFVIGP